MAIKAISKLEQFDNRIEGDTLGGQLQIYDNTIGTDLDIEACKDTNAFAPFAPKSDCTPRTDTFSQSFFEISQPVAPGRVLRSEFYNSRKLTYEQLMKNVCADVKSYLNAKNNLSCINVAQLAFGGYSFNGDKVFNNGVSISGDFEVGERGSALIRGKLSCIGDATFGKVTVNGQLYAHNGLTVDNNPLSTNQPFYVYNALTADPNYKKVSVVNLDVSQKLTTNELTSRTKIELPGCLTATTTEFRVDKPFYSAGGAHFTNGLTANTINCGGLTCTGTADLTALHAKWSDLAEYYRSDVKYTPGTLVKFGGSAEVTVADDEVNAVVTSAPALVMNASLKYDDNGCPIALAGRVPVRVLGKIEKFDRIMLSPVAGVAMKWNGDRTKTIIGRALASDAIAEEKLVECVVKFEI